MIETRDGKDTMGIEEYAGLPDDGYRTELVRGSVVREPQPGYRHGDIQLRLGAILVRHIADHGLDVTCIGPAGFVLERHPATVRGPDLAVVAALRVPAPDHPGFIEGAPDLVIEILSPSNRPTDIRERTDDFLRAGARLVWIIDHAARAVTVHQPGTPDSLLAADAELDGRDILPGLRIPIASLFRS